MNDDIISFLKDKNLLDNITKLVQLTGVIGEDIPIKSETLVCCGKLVKNKSTISTNLHPEDESGIGKDFLTEHLMDVVFHKDWIKYNSPTPTAVSIGQCKIKDKETDEWNTVDKKITSKSIVYVKDASYAFINGDDCKLLLEEKHVNLPKTINMQQKKLKWDKPVVIITTAGTDTENQLIRRLPSLHLNDTIKQTELIMEHQLNNDCNINCKVKIDNDLNIVKDSFYELKEVIVDLKDVKDIIKKRLPKCDLIIMRSLHSRLLDFIKFSTCLHQYQREKEGALIHYATEQDVDIGFKIFNYIYKDKLINISILNSRQRKIYEKMKKNKLEKYSAKQINMWTISSGVSEQITYKDIKRIIQTDPSNIEMDDKKRPVMYWYSGVFDV